MPHDAPENREMFKEIATLVASLGKAFACPESEVISALERGAVTLAFDRDENGNRFVLADYAGKRARVYQGAIKQESEKG
jgi:hypothetical protein